MCCSRIENRSRGASLKLVFFGLLLLGGLLGDVLPAFGHDMSQSESRILVQGQNVQVFLRLNLLEFKGVDTNGDGAISYDELDNAIDRVYAAIKQRFTITAPDAPVRVILRRYGVSEDHVLDLDLLYTFSHDVSELQVTSTIDQITRPGHQHLTTVTFSHEQQEGILNASNPTAIFKGSGPSDRQILASFVRLGVLHIFTGYDHLAFLIGLLIATTTLSSAIKVITSFTLAHSITLAAATFNLVILPSRLTESLIALSIVYVAAENLLGFRAIERYRITFLFGLVHGFGFSNVLREMQLSRSHLALSLFSFNTGVEIGQVLFVIVAFPLVLYLTKSPWQRQIVPAISLTVMCLATYWFVQRAFLA